MAKSRKAQTPRKYGAASIQVLKGLEAVRKRPGMYIGSTDARGLHHCVWELLDNAVDEAMAGYCDRIDVTVHADGSLSVRDNGRGIPVDIHPVEKMPGVELAMTTLHAGGKFDHDTYKVSGGLHGVGVSVVNALSAWMHVTVDRDGGRHEIGFERGATVEPLRKVAARKRTGTQVRFLPDPQIFETTDFDWTTLVRRLRQTAYLTAGLKVTLSDQRGEEAREEAFIFKRGLVEMIEHYNDTKDTVHSDVLHFTGEQDDVEIEVALQYNTGFDENLLTFVNNVRTPDGGTHETGFRMALTGAVNTWIADNGTKAQQKASVQGGDLREGLVAVVSVRVPDPQFEGQVKGKLGNSEVRGIVQSFLTEQLRSYFAQKPRTIRAIVTKAVQAAKGREAARKARDMTRKQKSLLETGVLPGKLADCSSNDASRNEVFIVEGDSAGGSAKGARDRSFQAILPLKGKILNVEKAAVSKILDNAEIKAIITALGTGFLKEFSMDDLRYSRVIIATDADVDGAHIRTLILTLFFRYMRELIDSGHVFIAQPPLFRLKRGSDVKYAYSDGERDEVAAKMGRAGGAIDVQRYKGLGEMNPEQLWETTMDPESRVLLQVSLDDAMEADDVFSTLMGDQVAPRRSWIMDNAQFAENIDL